MNEFLTLATRWAVRIVLIVTGAVFFLCLMAVACVLAAVWGVRALWAKLTGRPVAPWVVPMRGAASWSQMYQRAGGFGGGFGQQRAAAESGAGYTAAERGSAEASPFGGAAPGSKRSGILANVAGDVTDVKPREVHEG